MSMEEFVLTFNRTPLLGILLRDSLDCHGVSKPTALCLNALTDS